MEFTGIFQKAILHKRINRFIAEIMIEGERVRAHVPNTGRLTELFIEGAELVVEYVEAPHRKTQYGVKLVKKNGIWVSIDSQLPNAFLEECIRNHQIPELQGYTGYKREVTFGKSRFDFYLTHEKQTAFMEVKGCTLVKDQVCRFPDAPTERGTKHVKELIEAKKEGHGAFLFFLIQREDAEIFSPNDEMDPDFGEAVREAFEAGVQILCYKTHVTTTEITLGNRVEVKL